MSKLQLALLFKTMNTKINKITFKIIAAIFALIMIYGFHSRKSEPEYAEIVQAYKKDISKWPKPQLRNGAVWSELDYLTTDTLYFEILEQPEVHLGRLLFFDPKLSKSNQISCSSCHDPELGWTDRREVSLGNDHLQGKRNTPSLFNIGSRSSYFWDGRSKTLEEQAAGPLNAHHEMNMDVALLPKKIAKYKTYQEAFKAAYGNDKITYDKIVGALAAFQKTIKSLPSRFDAFASGNYKALSDQEIYGLHIFRTKAGCMNCHSGKYFTDEQFHNIGLTYYKREYEDLGLYEITKKAEDVGKFKTPSLRDLLYTRPWMHNGLFEDLTGIVNLYNSGMHGIDPTAEEKLEDPLYPVTDQLLQPLHLTDLEIQALVAFMESLSGSYYKMPRPKIPVK